jgi:hypothetical protein
MGCDGKIAAFYFRLIGAVTLRRAYPPIGIHVRPTRPELNVLQGVIKENFRENARNK